MKCKDCGDEIDGIGKLQAHKAVCLMKGFGETVPDDIFIIPMSELPEEIQLYSKGKSVGLRITGRLRVDGVVIEEVVLIR